MKPQLQKLPLDQGSSFVVLEYIRPYNETPWHYHPEYEIVLVAESEGTRFIGDDIREYKAGDLAFIGPNVPHLYRNTEAYYRQDPKFKTHNIVIHFLEDFLGPHFFSVREMALISKLFEKSKRALDIRGNTAKEVTSRLWDILEKDPTRRLFILLEILDIISKSEELDYISSYNMVGTNPSDADKINKVFEFVMQHYKSEIRVKDIAEMVNMSETGFSRYFRHRTRKRFSDFVSEIRIGHACKFLIEDKMNITEICYESGFNNVSNFNRQFKELMGVNPSSYKRDILKV